MKLTDLKYMRDNAPDRGQLLVYTREHVIFEQYVSLDAISDILYKRENSGNPDILEIHLFDQNKEYRAVYSQCGGVDHFIEYTADFADKEDEVFKEDICLEGNFKGKSSITVLNHISYDENGIASIDDYRLAMEV